MFLKTTQVLRDNEIAEGVSLRELDSALVMTVRRDCIEVEITVPYRVLEWFVSVRQAESGNHVEDWCDYTGYDAAPIDSLADDMADDLRTFINALLERPIRFTSTKGALGTRHALEWLASGGWSHAVPFGDQGVA
ncbi:MAG: hypothetical protein GY930_04855 [bacterium]|nr:hypothetical protein [bacterium]